jgi:hypothetical protein
MASRWLMLAGLATSLDNDEDIITDYTIFNCLNWKEILTQIDDYYHVNLFLIKNNTLIFKNYILSKSLYYYLTRFDIYRTSASGRRGRKAKATGDGNQATQECIGLTCYYEYMYGKSSQKGGSQQHIHATLMHEPWSMCVMQCSCIMVVGCKRIGQGVPVLAMRASTMLGA